MDISCKKILKENKNYYQSFYQYNPDAILSFDLSGIILNGNESVENLTGYSIRELRGSRLNSLVIEEIDSNLLYYLFIKAEEGLIENTEVAIRNKSGERIELAVEMAPLFVNDDVIGIYGILKG
ncbi:PAS domain S-box protein [Salipaludibacillus sp. CF4.18]|uniref:PAS domain S-box protein n=1 Tax=Salipaludibacillus sp. CF4.18 TaxID=3373081 RepID=UPI003EE6ACE1